MATLCSGRARDQIVIRTHDSLLLEESNSVQSHQWCGHAYWTRCIMFVNASKSFVTNIPKIVRGWAKMKQRTCLKEIETSIRGLPRISPWCASPRSLSSPPFMTTWHPILVSPHRTQSSTWRKSITSWTLEHYSFSSPSYDYFVYKYHIPAELGSLFKLIGKIRKLSFK